MSESVNYVEVLPYKKQELIFREGDKSDGMYVVQSGKVGIYANYGTEKQKELTVLEEGSFFGEMGMVRGLPRSATAVSLSSGTGVSKITWETLGQYFQSSPAKVVAIMQQMGRRIAELSGDYVEACGAVAELLEERDRLRHETVQQQVRLSSLQQDYDKVAGYLRKLDREVPQPSTPAAPKSAEPSQEAARDAIFRKYAAEYRKYQLMDRPLR